MIFDSNGNLILPPGTVESFREEMKRMKHPRREKTDITVTCPKCGHKWERMTKKAGDVRCHPCGQRIKLEALP